MSRHRLAISLLATVTVVGLVATPVGAATSAKKKGVAPLRVLVTNDDGVGAPGIDALVEGLRTLPKVKITVVAPDKNNSGIGDKVSTTPVTATDATTISGYDAVAVNGTPADSVIYALDDLGLKPQVVVSGNNNGQNLSAAVDTSGTVGAAKTAARAGIPALAVSQGIGDPSDFPAGVKFAINWVKQHRKAIAKGKLAATVANLNVPTCVTGAVRGLLEDLPAAPTLDNSVLGAEDVNCTSTLQDFANDIEAFNNGFATLNDVPTT